MALQWPSNLSVYLCFRPKFNKIYRKTTLIAKTSFSNVYDCVSDTNSDLIVKIQNPFANSISIHNEVRILQNLHDVSNVASLVYAEVGLCTSYLVFEKIHGLPLNKYMKMHPDTNKKVLVNQLLQVYKNIQQKHINHRDIKFDNILIERCDAEPGFKIHIIDFGMSVCQSDLHKCEHNEVAGTYQFQCPEMYRGMYYNGSCDTWSFGVLVYMIFFCKAPYIIKKREIQHCHTFHMIPQQMQVVRSTLAAVKTNIMRDYLLQMFVFNQKKRPLLKDLNILRL